MASLASMMAVLVHFASVAAPTMRNCKPASDKPASIPSQKLAILTYIDLACAKCGGRCGGFHTSNGSDLW